VRARFSTQSTLDLHVTLPASAEVQKSSDSRSNAARDKGTAVAIWSSVSFLLLLLRSIHGAQARKKRDLAVRWQTSISVVNLSLSIRLQALEV
jgi:hypothetical protein